MHIDNARIHHAIIVKEYAETDDIDINLCFGMPYRPDLAPIEDVYQKSKHLYRKQLAKYKALNQDWDQMELVQNIFDEIFHEFYVK